MGFSTDDAVEYRKRVLTPFKSQRLPELQAGLRELKQDANLRVPASLDLVELYDMRGVAGDAAVDLQVRGVADVFTKCLHNQSFKKIGPTLVELHQLLEARNPDLRSAAFWQSRAADRADRARDRVTDFAAVVAADAGVLGLVTTSRLDRLAQDTGLAGLATQAQIVAAVEEAGVQVVSPVVPPTLTVPAAVTKELERTSCASIVDAVFLDSPPTGFSVIDGFVGASGERLTLATVAASRQLTDQRSSNDNENGAVKRALGILRNLPDDRALADCVLAYFIELGRRAVEVEPALVLALKRLTDTRLDRRDAARILTLFADGSSRAGFPEVHQKVGDGLLREARRLFEAICAAAGDSVTTARTDAQNALGAAEQRVADLRAQARAAVESGDIAGAAQALNEALTICADDDTLGEMAAALPPAAPLNLAVSIGPDDRGVRVTWDPGFGTTPDVRYVVLGKAAAAPRNAHDGTVLATGLTTTSFEHPAPEIAADLHYAVAATRGSGFSPVVSQAIIILPPVRDVRVLANPDSITLSWNPPPGARAVRVVETGPDGQRSELAPNPHGSVTSAGLQQGRTYTYVLTALYSGSAGELAAAACRVTGTPRGTATPVAYVNLRERPPAGRAGPELEVTWQSPAGFPVEIWHATGKPRWPFGSRVPMAEIAAAATRLTGTTAGGDRRDGLRAPAPAGLRHYIAVTRDGDAGIIGQANEFGICPALAGVTAERFHDMLLLSWEWPGEEFDVDVEWDGLSPGRRRVTRPQYSAEGGLRISAGTGPTRVRLRTVPAAGDGAWRSAETVIPIEGTATSVRYTASWHKLPFRPPHAVTLSFASEHRPSTVPIVVVAQPGQVMPYSPDGAVVLAEETLDLSPSGRAELKVPLGGLGAHFWVRAFPRQPGVFRLVDPPSPDLRGA